MKRLLPIFLPVGLILLTMGCSLGRTEEPAVIPIPTKTKFPTAPAVPIMEPVSPVMGMPAGTDGYPWWNDSIFYEIYVRSFSDSNGDGFGDLRGIIQKLDYLNDGNPATSDDLGVSGIWLMPIFVSPTYHGYNTTDYYTIQPEYGTLDDLKDLLTEAHARGIRVILDLALNQTSYLHPWFIESQNPASPYRDWYVWSSFDPGYAGSWGQQVWWPSASGYYYGMISSWSPDLNYTNPDVTEEIYNVARYWLEDVGVDGYRLDAAKHLIEEGTIQVNSESTHQWWKEFRSFYKSFAPQAFTVAEIWEDTPITARYLQGDEVDLAFDFWTAYAFIQGLHENNAKVVTDHLEIVGEMIPPLQYGVFLTNHDQDRIMTQLYDDVDKAKVAASMMLTAPGVPFVYYGEEVGMQGEVAEDFCRRPMQWSDDAYGGFSTVSPWKQLGPGWFSFNVEDESADPDSLLSHYRALIHTRNEHAALRVGEPSLVTSYNPALYSLLRVSEDEAVLVLVNLGGEAITDYALKVEESTLAEGNYTLLPILGDGEFRELKVTAGGEFAFYLPLVEIPPYATYILQLHLNIP